MQEERTGIIGQEMPALPLAMKFKPDTPLAF
jgi:hypothetical protein